MRGFIRVVDVGGSGVRKGDYNLQTQMVRNRKKRGKIHELGELLEFVNQGLPPDCIGVAYACAGRHRSGRVVVSPNIKCLEGQPLQALTETMVGKPCRLYNDMQASVQGMAKLLGYPSYFLGLTLSTGVGGRIWKKGKVQGPLEPGHIILEFSENAPECPCGERGHVEAIIGGTAIRQKVLDVAKSRKITLRNGEPCAEMDKAFQAGKLWGKELYEYIGRHTGVFLAYLQKRYQFPLIVLRGTVATRMWDGLEPIVRESMQSSMPDPVWSSKNLLQFQFSPDPQNDGLIGAAELFCKEFGIK